MALTPAQLTTLKAAILAETNATFAVYRANGQTDLMAEWLNGNSNTDAWSSATSQQIDEATDYSAFDAVSAGKRDAWAMFVQYAPRDMSRARNRKVVTDVWGNATTGSAAEAILQGCVRRATRAEKALGGATISTTGTVSALNLSWTGSLSGADISAALSQ